ncbi:MAG: Mrp/NBP35 family ATP-binding protein [Oscillospiraceae bacterium]|nr:Mrp/NBP35 family ATP-binding protein [Oscillospiraceae bacterium]MBQ9981243.1 Mrp/NBP35 family ATP-binding protein [Oscillospiraceae bacterium]MBR6598850.1 Mrp/NBP35 family ATP-binding protein [Oscillospiraceae bacterium]
MSESCNHDCSSCSSKCSAANDLIEKTNEFSKVKKVIAVVSGKGGVGKSMVTSTLAVMSQRKGYKTAILDADITGPSIPKAFGVNEKAKGNDHGIFPAETTTGIGVMSLNLLVENDTDPVIWRGPVIAGTVKQFWTDVIWGDVDYMFIDMPPGTGDVPLTVFQSIPVDGIVIVTSPQELVSMIVGKAVKMAEMMNIPIIGIVENMSYVECDCCGKKINLYGESKLDEVAAQYGIKALARMPIQPKLASACDKGTIELCEDSQWLTDAFDAVESAVPVE